MFENGHVLAFLDIGPLAQGHTVVIPKYHAADYADVPGAWCRAMGEVLAELAPRIQHAVGATGYNLLLNTGKVAGQAIAHAHFHIVPRVADDGLGYRWNAKEADPEALARLAERVRECTGCGE